MVSWVKEMEGVGLKYVLNTIWSELEIPPSIPPALFVSKIVFPSLTLILSLLSEPFFVEEEKPEPISKPFTATKLSKQFDSILETLPMLEALSESDEAKITNLRAAYDAMDMYQQSFISKDSLAKLAVYEERLAQIKEANKTEDEGSEEPSENENGSTEEVTE